MSGEIEVLCGAGAVEGIGLEAGKLWIRNRHDAVLREEAGSFRDHGAAVRALLAALEHGLLPAADAAGHRVVHGGPDRDGPARVDAGLLVELRERIPLAPLHLPNEIQVIEAVASQRPALPQVACFDTAFHRRMPELAQRLPLPRGLFDEGVRRYGFHGLSYEYVLQELGDESRGCVVIAHLGNGVSLAAVQDGYPVDTTMGFTPSGGVMMGTRSGDLDPAVLLYLLNQRGWDGEQLARLVTREAGLLGVSGLSSDMRALLERRAREPHAAEAVEMFCYHVRKMIGALAAVLGGLDLLVFTGGIGERAPAVCREICRGLEHLGVVLADEPRGDRLSADGARCTVRVVPTNENLIIARHTLNVLFRGGRGGRR